MGGEPMIWKKTGRQVTGEGTTIIYSLSGTDITVESRKRHIPHASRPGTWDHTSYFVVKAGVEVAERYSLADAKEYAVGLVETT
jgi:hypothetical protein